MKRVLVLFAAAALCVAAQPAFTSDGVVAAQSLSSAGQPAPADYDGDGRADVSIKTDDGQWLIDYASNGFGAFDQTIVLQ